MQRSPGGDGGGHRRGGRPICWNITCFQKRYHQATKAVDQLWY